MEVPQAVIAQAKSAASFNQPQDGQPLEVVGSKEDHLASGQKYAYSRSPLATPLEFRSLDSWAKQ